MVLLQMFIRLKNLFHLAIAGLKENTNSITSSTSTMRKEGSKKMASSSCKSVKPGKKSFCTSYVGKEIQKLPKPSQSCYN